MDYNNNRLPGHSGPGGLLLSCGKKKQKIKKRIQDSKKVECEIRQALLLDWKQITGIEPASSAWEADVLPMNYICTTLILYHVFWKIQVYFHIFVKIRNDFCVFL